MSKVYRNTAILAVLIILGVQWGFYKTYTSQFPEFKDATSVIHIHGALLMAWLVMLVVQPILIAIGKNNLHRKLGQISWVLGPAVILMIYLVGRGAYNRFPQFQGKPEGLIPMALDIRGLFSFAIFWAMAMIYRKEHTTHMRFMMATGILGIGPGLGRALINSLHVPFFNAIFITDMISIFLVVLLLVFDIYKKKPFWPFLVVLAVLLVGGLMWVYSDSEGWMNFAEWYAKKLY